MKDFMSRINMPEMFGKIGRRITRLSSIWGSGNFQCINLAERRVYIDDPSRATIEPSQKNERTTKEQRTILHEQQTSNERFLTNEKQTIFYSQRKTRNFRSSSVTQK